MYNYSLKLSYKTDNDNTYRKELLKAMNLENYNNAGKIYVSVLGKTVETFLSFFDFIKLFFINSSEQVKQNEHIMLHKEINLDERI